MTKILACLSLLLAFAVSGGLVGWFTGVSESPVVASVGAVPTSYSVMKAFEPPTKSNLKAEQGPYRPEPPQN